MTQNWVHGDSGLGIRARVIADSINPEGDRLTTVEAVFNRYILAELNTHRMLSRNSASSRAIPVTKVMKQVLSDPAVPVAWGKNQKGMQARAELAGWRRALARRLFLLARFPALVFAWLLTKAGLHKQVTNRILEPWVWHTAIISATEWDNFFRLRRHPDAQPEFYELANCVWDAMQQSYPRRLEWGEWHTPYIDDDMPVRMSRTNCAIDDPILTYPKVSAACCARVSYVRQNDRRATQDDVAMSDKLAHDGHFSPLEHPAKATRGRWGNFDGWRQLRKFYDGEDGRRQKEAA